MPLLNAFVDSFVCVGFSSENGLRVDPESKNNGSLFTSDLQPTLLSIVTGDRAIYPTTRGSEFIDPSYPPVTRLSSRSSMISSISSGRSTPSSSLSSGIRTQKQHIITAEFNDLPFYCFPDGVQATYQRAKERIHHFVLTQNGKRNYALALTFQQTFTLKTNTLDADGIYQISDIKSSTSNIGRLSASKSPVAIDRQTLAPPPSTPVAKSHSRKMPSSFPNANATSSSKAPPTTSHDTAAQQRTRYLAPTISSFKKNLSPSAAPPPTRMGRARSQDNLAAPLSSSSSSSSSGISTKSTGMRKRTGSITSKPPSISTAPSASTSSPSAPLDPTKPFYLPHCFVLISTQPYWTAMQETISIIHDEIVRSNIEPSSNDYRKLIQKYAFFACNTPIPPVPWERFSLSFNLSKDQFVITFDPPINANRSVLDLDLSILLLTLNIGKLLDVLAALFTQQPIIFFSDNYSTLVTTLECILYLIYPLKWTNGYVPLIPDGLRDIYLEGPPGLYIKGAHSRHQAIVEKLGTSFICNLDDEKHIFVPNNVELHHIPPSKFSSFIDPITQLLEEIKVARALKSVPTTARLRMEQQREVDRQNRFQTNQKITKIFLALMIDLCGDALEPIYWTVNPQQITSTNTLTVPTIRERNNSNQFQTTATQIFSKEKYLLSKTEDKELDFYRVFVETIAFQQLIMKEMTSTSPTEFRQICQMYTLTNEDQLYHFNDTSVGDTDNNQMGSRATLCEPMSSQMILPLPDWSSDLSTHYLDSCIDIFTDELENAQQERSSAVLAVYAYLRGCARLARGDYLDGLRDLYLIENSNLFPRDYIETIILPCLADECLLDLFLHEPFYKKCAEWKKVRMLPTAQGMSVIDLEDSGNLIGSSPVQPSPDIILNDEWNIIANTLTYEQFSEHVHRLSIVLDQETTETLFKALLYWTDNTITKTLKKEKTLTNNTTKPLEPIKSSSKAGSTASAFTFQDTLAMLNDHRRGSPATTPTAKPQTQSNPSLPATLFELFLDNWQQTNAEKVRMNCHLPEDRQKQESILKVSTPGIVSKKDGPGKLILTQKRLYFLPETRSSVRLLTELINIVIIDKYVHQSVFSSPKPGIKIYTSSTESLPRDAKITSKSKTASLEKDSKSKYASLEKDTKSLSISLFFKTNQEQELWYTIIMELWSGLSIAHEQCDTAALNKASRHIALMDTLSNLDYDEDTMLLSDKQLTTPRQKSKQHHNEACLEMALLDLSTFTQIRQDGSLKPLSPETRNVLTRRLTPSINEIERHAVRCLLFTEHPETGRSSLWCAYGKKLKVFNVTTWICDPNDLDFPSLITCMCLDARHQLWVRCIGGQLFVVDTITRICEAELASNDGDNGCQTIAFDMYHNHILTANRTGSITLWNASDWERLYSINILELYKKAHVQQNIFKSESAVTPRNVQVSSNIGRNQNRKQVLYDDPDQSIHQYDIPSPTGLAQVTPLSTDKLESIQIYENLLFACYRDDYIIILRISDSNVYTFEHLVSVKYKTDGSVPIDSFLVYNKQIWISTGCIVSIFDVNYTNDENSYNLLMKKPVDNDNLVTMLGFSGYIWAGSLNGNVYVFRMDNYELYKTFAGHRDSVWCLCSMLDMYVVSGSAQKDTSIAIWENIQPPTIASSPLTKSSIFNL